MGYGAKKIIIIAGVVAVTSAFIGFTFFADYSVFNDGKIENNEEARVREPVLVPPIFPPKIIGDEKFYKNILLRFSISFPKDLNIKEYDEGRGSLIVFENEKGEKGFQVFAVPYEGEEVSKERFKMDVPSGVMNDPMDVIIDGVTAKAFFFLYEVTTYKALDEWLAKIMQSWRFL
ncbi:MAG: hypothetical protein HW401_648 [Parcubacteria group bacterium]|nr:hypothetical protein [Parcubacteria group bacterium]